MNFTFGIITTAGNEDMVNLIIDSIERENIPTYEIVVVGGSGVYRSNVVNIPFDETIKPSWITRKKNTITKAAKYENIVYLHDYIKFNEGWYRGQTITGNDFYVRMDKIFNLDGTRFRDWVIWPHNGNEMDNLIGRNCLIPYDITHLSKYQYISGTYWIAKKSVMLEFPLNEALVWGQGEDVLWSKWVRQKYPFNMNANSSVQIMKPNKDRAFFETTPEQNTKLRNL